MDYRFIPNIYYFHDYDINVAPLDLSNNRSGNEKQRIGDGGEAEIMFENANSEKLGSEVYEGGARFANSSLVSSRKTNTIYRKIGKRRRRGKRGGGRGGARVGSTVVTSHVKEAADCEVEPRCDFCLLTAKTNPNGEYEEFLVCNDCGAKAHPSCMNYEADLAQRCRQTRWQCISCKICTICRDPGDDDNMLFCDYCDKGYHMKCHRPVVNDKPNGKWACHSCQVELTPAKDLTVANHHNSATDNTLCAFSAGYKYCNGSTNHTSEMDRYLKDYPNMIPDASNWTIDDVEHFVTKVGFPDQAPFFREQEIDGRSLLLMKRNDVLTGLSIRLGPALKIYNHIRRLQVFFGISHSCSS